MLRNPKVACRVVSCLSAATDLSKVRTGPAPVHPFKYSCEVTYPDTAEGREAAASCEKAYDDWRDSNLRPLVSALADLIMADWFPDESAR